ncbi:hypothetical protein D1610_06750 [Sphingomonas gilva]|uniref:Tyrosinase copper-binding domain-containing protein n=1 Tax=Sphingomonas gilva TaxID=2305907 RepID=A0A396RNU1_9SPHN|nr:tyrosinase family protein [Sphingomonas gilva]RHW18177.1 hypothetical protein D1610_06750 [Sphingomonas gilva]
MMQMVEVDRRAVLAGFGVGAVAVAANARIGAPSAPHPRVRREIRDLERWFPDDLNRLKNAVAEMRKSRAGAMAWDKNAEIHSRRCGVPSGEIHRTLHFLPWHRAFLWATERNLQHAIGDETVSLAYWHWPVLGAVPASFRATPLAHDRTRLDLFAHEYAFQSAMDSAEHYVGKIEEREGWPVVTQLGFGGYDVVPGPLSVLEGTPHGSVHNALGKDMGNIKWSPRDPLFFGHHANLDRMWETWRGASHSARRRTEPWQDRLFAETVFEFFDLATGKTRNLRVAEVSETAALGYRYALPGEGVDGGQPVGTSTSGQNQNEVPDPALLGVPLASGDARIGLPTVAVSIAEEGKAKAILTVQGIQIPANQGGTVAIYLFDRKHGAFSPRRAAFVGTIGLVQQDTATEIAIALDVTTALRQFPIESGRIGVAIVPVGQDDALSLAVSGYAIEIVPQ